MENKIIFRCSCAQAPIKFKGHVHSRQFLLLNRGRFIIKGFVIAGSASGYVIGTSIYSGKEGPAASKDLAPRVVLKLTEPYINKGVNNWYTSVPLFLELEILLPKNINFMVYFDNFFSSIPLITI